MGVVYVMHGKDWESHKYLRKEKLSNGEYRYYYPYNLPKKLRGDVNSSYPVERRGHEYNVHTTNEWTKDDWAIKLEIRDIITDELGKTVKSMVLNRDLSAAKKLASNIRGRVGDIEVSGGTMVVESTDKRLNKDLGIKEYRDTQDYSNSLRYAKRYNKK